MVSGRISSPRLVPFWKMRTSKASREPAGTTSEATTVVLGPCTVIARRGRTSGAFGSRT